MVRGDIKVIDARTKEVVSLPVTPGRSLLRATPFKLSKGLNVDRLFMEAGESPEIVVCDHLLTLQMSPQHLFETRDRGQLKQITKDVGSVTLAPAGFRFWGRWDKAVEIVVLTLEPAVVAKCADELHAANRNELVRCTGKPNPQVLHLGLALEAEREAGHPNGQYFWESLSNALSISVLNQFSAFKQKIQHHSGGLSSHQLKRTIEYINDNLAFNLSLDVLATMLSMSPYYFERLFKQSVGRTPLQYIISCRVERAKVLLRTTRQPIMSVASQVGYQNHSHFSRLFRKLTGVSPSAYRNQF